MISVLVKIKSVLPFFSFYGIFKHLGIHNQTKEVDKIFRYNFWYKTKSLSFKSHEITFLILFPILFLFPRNSFIVQKIFSLITLISNDMTEDKNLTVENSLTLLYKQTKIVTR